MKLSYNNANMMPEGVNTKSIPFKKISTDHEGMPVLGLFKNPNSRYGVSYSLISKNELGYIGLNIPSWLGAKIEEDFIESGETVEIFFNVIIDSVTEIATSKGNPTKEVTFRNA